MGAEENQPVAAAELTQEDKTHSALVQGLIMGAGFIGIIPFLGFFGFLAAIAVVVLFFVWKDRGDFVKGHLRQALGLVIIWFAIGLVFSILSAIALAFTFTSAMSGNVGALGGLGGGLGLFKLIQLLINVGIGILGLMGMLAAQKGEPYEYPVVGKFITNFGAKKSA